MSFTDGKPRVATEEDVHANWSGGKDGKYFRCGLCGHKFVVGDYWRFVFTNNIPGAAGNPLVCKDCDGYHEGVHVIERWKKMCEDSRTKYWWFNREGRR